MTDNVNVVLSVTEKGLASVQKDVEALRSELQNLGIDMSTIERRLGGLESTTQKFGREVRSAASETGKASASARGWAESLTTVWARQFREAEKAEAAIRRVKAAQDAAAGSARTAANLSGLPANGASPRVGSSFGNIVDDDARAAEQASRAYSNLSTQIDEAISSRQRLATSFSSGLQARLQEENRSIDEQAKAQDRLTAAQTRSVSAERALNRERSRRENANAAADFDAQYDALVKVTDQQENFVAGRYALYDVAASYAAIGTALAGASIYAVTVGAQFESAFTNVERTLETDTTADQVDAIRASLVRLSGQIPLTFAEISQIATLGNQLGLGADEVVGFTETVARFASVSGLSIDAVSNSFGGFLAQTGLSSQYLENLGSSIALVGINSNATEAQIVSLVREIAAGANGAGFAADEIVGLAGALASFQVAPERARGVLDTYFATLNRAVAEGGDRLELFANITGRTAEELDKLVRGGEGATVFRDVLSGIQELNPDAAQLTQILDGLGLSGLRASNTFQRFLGNLGIADRAFEDAYKGFVEGSELNRQYAATLDDLSSQFTIFINGLNALAAAASGGTVDSLAGLFMGINNVVFAIADFINENQLAANIIGIGVAVTGIIGGFLLFRSVLILATAAIYAARTAIASVGGAALASAGTIRGLAGAFVGLQGASAGAAGGVFTLRTAIRSLLASTGIGLLVTVAGSLLGTLFDSGTAASDAALSLDQYKQATQNSASAASGATDGADALADSLGNGVADGAEEAAEKVRTLVDYVSDLNGVFRRSSDIRFGQQDAFDEITLAWMKITDEVAKYQSQIRSLTADRKLKEYFLGIAELYDDQIRAGELREDIAQIDEKLAEAQAGASTELEGNSKAAIENRKVFRDLLGSYEDYVSALASAGASQEQIQAVISQLNGEFGAQATALGFNANEVANYQDRFQDLSTIISQIPPVNVTFDGGPAEIALAEFFAKAEEQARLAGQNASDAFENGLGGGLGEIPFDDLFPKGVGTSQGRQVGKNWWEEFLNFLEQVFVDFPTTVGEYIGSAIENAVTEGNRLAAALWSGFSGWLGEVFSGFPEFIRNLVIPAEAEANLGGQNVGGALTAGLNSRLNQDQSIYDWTNRQGGAAYQNGSYLGGQIGGGIADGLANALAGRRVGTPFAKGYSSGGFVDLGFSSGGYTGAGHWLQPAGLVHKGEYVVPKRHVDQATGLPSVEYVASLNRGKSAPKGGYATGGHVSGGLTGPFELGPSTLGYLASALRVNLNVGQEQLARSVSNGDSKLAWQGSN
ncbi:tape measure protein [Microbacterium phage ASegato]|nr:tape measure protein [Microbacterium phage ASegato]